MTLQNAFGDIALDSSVQQVKTSVDGLLTNSQLRASDVKVSLDGEAISVNLPTDAATESTQSGYWFQIIRLLKKIAFPAWFDPSLNRARMTTLVESGTVTTVSTVSNQTNIGGYTAEQLIRMQTRSAWAAGQRARLT